MPDLSAMERSVRMLTLPDLMGLEAFTASDHRRDAVGSLVKKAFHNLATAFSAFSRSELQLYHDRYGTTLRKTFSTPLMGFSSLIVPVPSGMAQPYLQTTESLLKHLDHLALGPLQTLLPLMLGAIEKGRFDLLQAQVKRLPPLDYDKVRGEVSKLFHKNGQTFLVAGRVFPSRADVQRVDTLLTSSLPKLYRDVSPWPNRLKVFEEKYRTTLQKNGDQLSVEQRKLLHGTLIYIGQSIALHAVILDQLQRVEHAFVGALTKLRSAVGRQEDT